MNDNWNLTIRTNSTFSVNFDESLSCWFIPELAFYGDFVSRDSCEFIVVEDYLGKPLAKINESK